MRAPPRLAARSAAAAAAPPQMRTTCMQTCASVDSRFAPGAAGKEGEDGDQCQRQRRHHASRDTRAAHPRGKRRAAWAPHHPEPHAALLEVHRGCSVLRRSASASPHPQRHPCGPAARPHAPGVADLGL